MANIIILDELTANQIAAGEVVERPVSVVKELVENALDAGACRIVVDIVEGGLAAITIADDGCGMSGEDLRLAFQRHATSKIKCASDLSRIMTLGFRGEALPSIAAVSRMDVTTRTHDELIGNLAEVEGGSMAAIVSAGCPPGTTVAVKDLFYNTPARRKTMKSPSTEGALCGDLISRLALTRPDVRFELSMKGRRVFYSPGTGSLIDSVTAVYGVHQGREMIAVNVDREGLLINGFAGKPSLSRSTRNHIIVIINGRYVRCLAVAGAVEEAYRTLLPQGRRPVAVLSLAIAPELLDVNVHPAKLEVRLLEEEKVAGLVTRALRDALRVKAVVPSTINVARKGNLTERSQSQITFTGQPDSVYPPSMRPPVCPSEQIGVETVPINDNETDSVDESCLLAPSGYDKDIKAGEEKTAYDNQTKSLPVLTVIGQLPPTYILAGGGDGLYIIDQHAAHERILYEEYLDSKEERPSQYLLMPVTLELDYREAAVLTDRVLWFTDAGFVIEHFGGNTFLLRGIPTHFPAGQEKELFLNILDYFRERGPGASRVEFFDHLAAAMACRTAVKAGEKLSSPSMGALLRRLAQTANPFTCPHGRPTIIQLSYRDLETKFKRS